MRSDDGGGTLDLKELRNALLQVKDAAKQWRSTPDPNAARVAALRKRVQLAEEAAETAAQAESLETELEQLTEELASRADVRLGVRRYSPRCRAATQHTSVAALPMRC